MNLYDIVNNYPNNEVMKKLMDNHKVLASHVLSKSFIDGCEKLGVKGTHQYRTVETLKVVGFGKIIEASRTYSRDYIVYITSTANRVVFDSNGMLITIVPQSAAHIRRQFPAFAATQQGKQVCKFATAHKEFNIWDYGSIR